MAMKEFFPKKLVILTLALTILIAGGALTYHETSLPSGININTKGQPTIGYAKAKVHIVLFEEPKCVNCKEFTKQVFPKIKKEFIDTNKAKFTVIPVSFLPDSMPAAIAMLCVFNEDPLYPNNDLCFTYLDYIYTNQPDEHSDWATTDQLVDFAERASPAINTQKLGKCIDAETYRIKIEKNTQYGRTLMGGSISTPTVYVNGIEVKELSYDSVRKLILEVLNHEGGS